MTKLTSLLKTGLVASTLLLTACATTQQTAHVNDPLESYNRVMYSFNSTVDKAVTKPIAQGYNAVMPDPVNKSISNFFSNLDDITVIINDLLQFKFSQAVDDTGRFLINSTVGLAGLFDVASGHGLEKNNEDFGQTLGAWGVDTGPYIVWPLIGPSNVRDTVGLVGDYYTDPITYVTGPDARNPFIITRIVDNRANLLKAEKVLDEAAIDEYSYVRDAYLQRRENLVHDGNPPEEEFDVFAE